MCTAYHYQVGLGGGGGGRDVITAAEEKLFRVHKKRLIRKKGARERKKKTSNFSVPPSARAIAQTPRIHIYIYICSKIIKVRQLNSRTHQLEINFLRARLCAHAQPARASGPGTH